MKNHISKNLALGLIALAGFIPSFEASPVQFGANYYDFVAVPDPFISGNNSWFTADAATSGSVYGGAQGHLATITSLAETTFFSVRPVAGLPD